MSQKHATGKENYEYPYPITFYILALLKFSKNQYPFQEYLKKRCFSFYNK